MGDPLPEDPRGSVPQALPPVRRLFVALAGSTGVVYGIRLLARLRQMSNLTLDLVLTEATRRAIPNETECAVADVTELADHVVDARAATVPLADAMIVAPCDMDAAAAIAARIGPAGHAGEGPTGDGDLISSTAVEILECRRPLIVMVHQSPLGVDHLRCLLRLSESGAVILPPVPAFYNRPQDVEGIVLHTVARVIDRLGLPQSFAPEWQGSQRRT
jgi:flavin prenyltransferase